MAVVYGLKGVVLLLSTGLHACFDLCYRVFVSEPRCERACWCLSSASDTLCWAAKQYCAAVVVLSPGESVVNTSA